MPPLWFCRGLADQINQTPMYADGIVFGSSGDMAGGVVIAMKPGGSGDVTETHRVWRQPRVKGAIGTGVIRPRSRSDRAQIVTSARMASISGPLPSACLPACPWRCP